MKDTPKVIGLSGRKRAGKSTVADFLHGYTRISFASPLKRMAFAMGVTQEEAENKEGVIERFGCSPRHIWQTLGTDWGRDMIHRDIWVRIAKFEAEKLLALGYNVVFDDVRFDNEAEMILSLGGVVWQVHRPGSGTPEGRDSHVSEKGISEHLITMFIPNWGDKAELLRQTRITLDGGRVLEEEAT